MFVVDVLQVGWKLVGRDDGAKGGEGEDDGRMHCHG